MPVAVGSRTLVVAAALVRPYALAASVTVVAASMGALWGCTPRGASPPPRSLEALRVGIAQPAGSSTTAAALAQAASLLSYAALVTLAADGRAQPGLAESWTSPDDGLTWRFRLRPGLTFTDGSRLDAAAVALSLGDALANPRLQPGLRDIVSVTADDETALVIRQRTHSSLLFEALSFQWIEGRGGLTAGPYRIVSTGADTTTLAAFDGYYRGRATVDRIGLRGYPTQRAAWVALMRDEIDFLYEVPAEAAEFVEAATDIGAFSFLRSYVHLFGFNVAHPLLRDVRVRRAIAHAIDRQALIAYAFAGRGQPATGTVWPRHWAYDAAVEAAPFDRARARTLLQESLGGPAGKSRRAPAGRLHLGCMLPGGYPAFERSALVIQRQLLDVGIDLVLEVLPARELIERLATGRFETYLFEQATAQGFDWPYWFWHSPGDGPAWIRSGYVAADDVLDRLRRAQGPEAFEAAVGDFQRRIVDDPPAVFLAWNETSRAVNRRFAIPTEPGRDIFTSLAQWQASRPVATR